MRRCLAEKLNVTVHAPQRYQATFPASPMGARQARCAVTTFAKTWLRGRDLSDFEAAVGEVLANAVEHGGGDHVSIECYFDSGKVVAEIRDSGGGFLPPPAIRMPRDGAPRGYGLFIMHCLLDDVQFLDGGRMLRLLKSSSSESN